MYLSSALLDLALVTHTYMYVYWLCHDSAKILACVHTTIMHLK